MTYQLEAVAEGEESILIHELRTFMKDGLELPLQKVEEVIAQANTDGNGKINCDEFIRLMGEFVWLMANSTDTKWVEFWFKFFFIGENPILD